MKESALNNGLQKIKLYYAHQRKITTALFVLIAIFIMIGVIAISKMPILGLAVGFAVLSFLELLRLFFYQPMIVDEERRYQRSAEGDFGTAEPMGVEEKELAFNKSVWFETTKDILGAEPEDPSIIYTLKQGFGINDNQMIIGAPGSGKTTCIAIPMIMQTIRRGESMIVTDPKGELYGFTSCMARAHGYNVKIINFNPDTMIHSDSCDYLSVVGTNNLRAMSFSRTIIENTLPSGMGWDFWAYQKQNLLTAEILKVENDESFREKTLTAVFKDIISNKALDLASYFEQITWNHPAKGFGMSFNTSDATVQGNTKADLAVNLSTLNDPTVQKVIGTKDIDFTLPGREKCIYYIASSDQDTSMRFYMALFFTNLYQELVKYADAKDNGKLDIKVRFLLDEFVNIGLIPYFPNKLATVRGRGIDTSIIIQDLGQLQKMYPDNEWETIINCCSTLICMRTNSMLTADYISKRTGIETTITEGATYQRSKVNVVNARMNENIREQKQKRYSRNPDEVCRLGDDELIVIPTGHNAAILKKVQYWTHPMCKEMRNTRINYHMPNWVRELFEENDESKLQLYGLSKETKKTMFRGDKKRVESIILCDDEDFKEPWTPAKQKKLQKWIKSGAKRSAIVEEAVSKELTDLIEGTKG